MYVFTNIRFTEEQTRDQMMQVDTNGAGGIKPNVRRGYQINKTDTAINKMYNPPHVSLYEAEYTRD